MEVVVPLLLLFLDEVLGVVLDVMVLDDVCVQDVLLVAWGLLGFDLGVLCAFVGFVRLLLVDFLVDREWLVF